MTVKSIKITNPKNDCWIFHRWRIQKDTGVNQYYECKDCRARIFKSSDSGYQPVNIRWLVGETDSL